MKKPQFATNYIYHIYNRGVEKRSIFLDDKDYFRFIHYLFELNDDIPVHNISYYFQNNIYIEDKNPDNFYKRSRKRQLLVDILTFALMPNHFHLLLMQKRENGIVKFMQKLGTGYAMYFNQKYKRVGGLFQGSYKAILVDKEPYFIHLPFYIHTNPIELQKNTAIEAQLKFLKHYRWSSYLDYIGISNFPSVINKSHLLNFFDNKLDFQKETKEWLKAWKNKSSFIRNIIFEEPYQSF